MNETSGQRPEPTSTIAGPVPDVQLQLLVRLLDQDPRSSLPITLSIPGGPLYGDMIAHEAWKADWAKDLHRMEGAGARALADFPESVDQVVGEMSGEEDAQSLPQWIHLRDVTLLTGALSPVTAPLWRGRLADVCGWSLGNPQQ